jgi:hypothetical protein
MRQKWCRSGIASVFLSAGNTKNYDDREKYLDQTREMEDRTHMLLKGQNA